MESFNKFSLFLNSCKPWDDTRSWGNLFQILVMRYNKKFDLGADFAKGGNVGCDDVSCSDPVCC